MSTVLDAEPVVLEESESVMTCDCCDDAARWTWLWSCGCVNLLCEDCDRLLDEEIAKVRVEVGEVWCDECNIDPISLISRVPR
ncbi:hypothetical protein SEA_MARCIE_4 [Microbacterium phage Marcie]|nr:hypothetical protein SEA_MARCIE_4 [Microbacterium phage Marcie]